MQDDVDAEMRRLKQELQRTMEMYSTACKQAQTTKQQKVSDEYLGLVIRLIRSVLV